MYQAHEPMNRWSNERLERLAKWPCQAGDPWFPQLGCCTPHRARRELVERVKRHTYAPREAPAWMHDWYLRRR